MVTEKHVMIQDAQGQVILYKNHLEVRLEKDTVWLTQKQMSELFDTERSVVTKHLRNILKTKELEEKSVCAIFAHTEFSISSLDFRMFPTCLVITERSTP